MLRTDWVVVHRTTCPAWMRQRAIFCMPVSEFQHRADRDIKRAEHQAEQAEQDAADAIDLALYVLDQAQYAIVDAAIARADADDLAGNR